MQTTEQKLLRLPISCDWVEYKGETVFMMINYHETERVGRPMVDLAYCATRGLNGNIERTVQWDKNKFKPSRLSKEWPV